MSRGWSDDRLEALRQMCEGGVMSASMIAAELGGVSRNAVCGAASRLGLSIGGGGHRLPRTAGVSNPRAPKPPKPTPITREAADVLLARELPPTDDPFSAKGCRWPIGEVGDADFRFCQRPKGKRLNGTPSMWCEGHHAIGHQRHTENFGKNYGKQMRAAR
jgi:GcrA cell cycle regulator